MWSLLPIAYVAHFAYARDFADVRLDVMLAPVTLWGFRLTFNFWYGTLHPLPSPDTRALLLNPAPSLLVFSSHHLAQAMLRS